MRLVKYHQQGRELRVGGGGSSGLWEFLCWADEVLAPAGVAVWGQHGGPALLTGGPHRAEEEAIQ